jgi:hypothetical protein
MAPQVRSTFSGPGGHSAHLRAAAHGAPGRSADGPFDVLHAVLAEVAQRPVAVVGQQPTSRVARSLVGAKIHSRDPPARALASQRSRNERSTTTSLIALARTERSCSRREACAGSPRPRTDEDRPGARRVAGDRAGPVGPRQDPRTGPPGSRRRWHPRDAGTRGRTARAASRAARLPVIPPTRSKRRFLAGTADRVGSLPTPTCQPGSSSNDMPW